MTEVASRSSQKHFKDIPFGENRARLKLLNEFRELVILYFDNSRPNLMGGSQIENKEASEAREAINLILNRVYAVIRLAGITPSASYNASLASKGQGKNIDLILNIFNLGRNDIPSNAAIDYIERAIDVYRSNRLDSLLRTVNPFYWVKGITHYLTGGRNKEKKTCNQ